MGQVVRAGLLVVMGGLTWWKGSVKAARWLLGGALVVGVLAVIAFA